METNFKRRKEFIEFFQYLQEEKNSIYTKDQLIKLKTYSDSLFADCFFWKHRNLYLELLAGFLNSDISGEEFSEQLIPLRSNHIREFNDLMKRVEINFEFLNKFNFDSNAFGFLDIIDLVYENCDSFVSDQLLREIGGFREAGEIDEDQLRQRIEKDFLRIAKKYFSTMVK